MFMASCSRGTCGAPAVAGLAYDSASLSVWVIDLHANRPCHVVVPETCSNTSGATRLDCLRRTGWTPEALDSYPSRWISSISETKSGATATSAKWRILEVEELQLFELDDPPEVMATVASLDAARNSGRSLNRVELKNEASSRTLMG